MMRGLRGARRVRRGSDPRRHPLRRTLKIGAAAVTLAAVAPAGAQAATVTVTGDDGNPVAINPAAPPTIRNMDVEAVTTVVAADGPRYRTQVFGPDGVPVSTQSPCLAVSSSTSWRNFVDYRGNGVYRVVVQRFSDTACAQLTRTAEHPFGIAAGVAVGQPQNWLLSRAPNDLGAIQHEFEFLLNPGATIYEVRYARGGVIGADGAISGPSQEGFVDSTTGRVPLRFDAPGDWVVVARAKSGDYFTPWSAPVRFRVKGPFDLQTITFPDRRGPRYSLRGVVRERAAAGRRVTVAIARGSKGRKFRRLGRAKIRRNGTFSLRFTVRRTGRYRLRYTFRGTGLVAKGQVVQRGIRIRRRLI
jgi:hypothetical protein